MSQPFLRDAVDDDLQPLQVAQVLASTSQDTTFCEHGMDVLACRGDPTPTGRLLGFRLIPAHRRQPDSVYAIPRRGSRIRPFACGVQVVRVTVFLWRILWRIWSLTRPCYGQLRYHLPRTTRPS